MSVAAVDRTVSLIEALASEPVPVELSALAERVGLPLSAAHRILATLVERGLVVQHPASSKYQLSLRLAVLAFRSLEARRLPDVVQSVLDRLAERTREYCRLAVAENDELVWIARAQGASAGLRYDPDMGEEIVLHATANGKAWLASIDPRRAARILQDRGLEPPRELGPGALKTMDAVLQNLEQVRSKGFATAEEEAEAGAVAVAVAFRAGSSERAPIAGTISVAGPSTRITKDRYEELAAALHDAAAEIGEHWPIRAFGESSRPTRGPR